MSDPTVGAPVDAVHEGRHGDAAAEEWVFACWAGDGSVGAISALRLLATTGWYWAALVRPGAPLLHVAEWELPRRADHRVIKAHGLWAEHVCEAPMEQWTISNECFATAFDDPAEALARAYGVPTALAFDLEWYATAPAQPLAGVPSSGYVQDGVVHGAIDLPGGAVGLSEVPARRWHRWGAALAPLALPRAYAHGELRAPFVFPDGTTTEWVLTPDGWRAR